MARVSPTTMAGIAAMIVHARQAIGTDREVAWPDPRESIVPYAVSAEAKDRVEWRLADAVCAGSVSLEDAQRSISRDWTTAKELLRVAP